MFIKVNILAGAILLCIILFNFRCYGQPFPPDVPEGCGGIRVSTSNGILVNHTGYPTDVSLVFISSEDSIFLSYTDPGGCMSSLLQIQLNNLPVNYHLLYNGPASGTIKLMGKCGTYDVLGMVHGSNQSVSFTLALKPVGIVENNTPQELMIYPNPCKEALHLDSKEELENVSIINALGAEVQMIAGQGHSMEICLLNCTPGLYYLRVGLLTRRIIIKKFAIL